MAETDGVNHDVELKQCQNKFFLLHYFIGRYGVIRYDSLSTQRIFFLVLFVILKAKDG